MSKTRKESLKQVCARRGHFYGNQECVRCGFKSPRKG